MILALLALIIPKIDIFLEVLVYVKMDIMITQDQQILLALYVAQF
jgi:hypothetical protein